MRMLLLVAFLCTLLSPAFSQDPDSDGDGLSDFQETHKYRTDPRKKDTDRDGIPDGNWLERREYTYTIRTVIQVMPTYDKATLTDDYQDCRVLHECDEYIELEVIHYPLNTCASAIAGTRDWKRKARRMSEFLKPGPTTNWDKKMRRDLLSRLRAAKIDVDKLNDKEIVERVSKWALGHARSLGKTCIWAVGFKNGRPAILEPLQGKFEGNRGDPSWTPKEQFAHELYGRGMYENRSRGTCTTSANYLATIMRAVGIPTRIIVTIPLVDGSDPRNVEMLKKRLTHHEVRRQIVSGVSRLKNSFAAHIYNEVFVGGRWRRLNYDRLGQNILDSGFLGLMTHVHTFRDLAEAHLGDGWGLGRLRPSDVFRHSNPYTALTVSDQFGVHSKLKNPLAGHQALTISKIYWFASEKERPAMIGLDWHGAQNHREGHLLMHVVECKDGEGAPQYSEFHDGADTRFVLRAAGRPEVRAESLTSWWVDKKQGVAEFYLRIPAGEFDKMKRGVPYELKALNEKPQYQWKVRGVSVTRPVN